MPIYSVNLFLTFPVPSSMEHIQHTSYIWLSSFAKSGYFRKVDILMSIQNMTDRICCFMKHSKIWRYYFRNVDSCAQNFRKVDLDLKSGYFDVDSKMAKQIHFSFRNSRMWIFFELFPKSGYFWYVLRDYP